MRKSFVYSLLASAALVGAGEAAEFSGAYLNLDYSTFTDTDFGDA